MPENVISSAAITADHFAEHPQAKSAIPVTAASLYTRIDLAGFQRPVDGQDSHESLTNNPDWAALGDRIMALDQNTERAALRAKVDTAIASLPKMFFGRPVEGYVVGMMSDSTVQIELYEDEACHDTNFVATVRIPAGLVSTMLHTSIRDMTKKDKRGPTTRKMRKRFKKLLFLALTNPR